MFEATTKELFNFTSQTHRLKGESMLLRQLQLDLEVPLLEILHLLLLDFIIFVSKNLYLLLDPPYLFRRVHFFVSCSISKFKV